MTLLLTASGCAARLEEPERFLGFCRLDVERDVLPRRCGTAACHEGDAPAAGLDLVAPDVFARLVGQPSRECPGEMLVAPGGAGSGFFVEKLDGPRAGCGDRMPLLSRISVAERDCISDWLGAQSPSATVDAGVPATDGGVP